MFQLYDTTRRRICITGFIALGVLPTLLVAAWCARRHLPSHLQSEAQKLSWQLGVDVRLQGVKHLRPGIVLYEGLEIVDPEVGHVLLRCSRLEAASRQSSDRQQSRPVLVLTASQPEIDAVAIGRLLRLFQRTMEGHHGQRESDLQLAAGDITLHAAAESQTLTDVVGSLDALPAGARAQVHFRLPGANGSEPMCLRVVRNRQISPPANRIELDTGGNELPCSVLALGVGELKPLGSRSRFRGCIWASETADGWEGEIAGQLAELDLDRLVTDRFPHRLSGSADLVIQSARFRRGRLEEACAMLSAGPGTIDRSLIDALIDRLGLTATTELQRSPEQMPYAQLAFSLKLDAGGVRIQGLCPRGESGTILANQRGRMLGEPRRQPRPVVTLVQALVPQNDLQVPASRQTDWLLQYLPIPQIVSAANADNVAPHAQLRLPNTQQK